MGLKVKRFKTGTSPRIDYRSIDFSKLEVQDGQTDKVLKFSSQTNDEDIKNQNN